MFLDFVFLIYHITFLFSLLNHTWISKKKTNTILLKLLKILYIFLFFMIFDPFVVFKIYGI